MVDHILRHVEMTERERRHALELLERPGDAPRRGVAGIGVARARVAAAEELAEHPHDVGARVRAAHRVGKVQNLSS